MFSFSRNHFIYFLLGVVLAVMSCKKPPQPRWQTVKIGDLYQIDLPTHLQARNDMHEVAKLQYYDLNQDFYLICLDESKDNVRAIRPDIRMDDYYKMVEDTVMANATNKKFLQGFKRKHNQTTLKEGDYEVEQELDGMPYHLLYRIAVLESKKHFFQLVMYTPYKDSCQIFEKMDSITHSFFVFEEADKT